MPWPDLGEGSSPASMHGILFRLHPPSLLGERGEVFPILILGGRRESKSFIRQTPPPALHPVPARAPSIRPFS